MAHVCTGDIERESGEPSCGHATRGDCCERIRGMDERQTDGPRPPNSPGVRPQPNESNATFRSFTSTTSSCRSPFTTTSDSPSRASITGNGRLATLISDGAELMMSTDGHPIDPDGQGGLFSLHWQRAGRPVGTSSSVSPMPRVGRSTKSEDLTARSAVTRIPS